MYADINEDRPVIEFHGILTEDDIDGDELYMFCETQYFDCNEKTPEEYADRYNL
jgi:hypothetical protein